MEACLLGATSPKTGEIRMRLDYKENILIITFSILVYDVLAYQMGFYPKVI